MSQNSALVGQLRTWVLPSEYASSDYFIVIAIRDQSDMEPTIWGRRQALLLDGGNLIEFPVDWMIGQSKPVG